MFLLKMIKQKRQEKKLQEKSFEARLQMESAAQKHIDARLKALEYTINIKGRR